MKPYVIAGLAVVGSLLTIAMVFTSGWNLPPAESSQLGYRGVGLVETVDKGGNAATVAANMAPEPIYPYEPIADEPLAKDVYENVQVLGDLPDSQFTRLMAHITEWVAPEEGCGYCHNLENLADDSLYTKVVSRRMIQMTQHINVDWTDHVADTGVTCYTCHRGQNVPAEIWFSGDGPKGAKGMAGYRGEGQNVAGVNVGLTSLNYDPFTPLLLEDGQIRVATGSALPAGANTSIQLTERTYSLMIHMSEGLGVNCAYCHNSRNFADWGQSSPARMTAWHGIQMVRDLNNEYLVPLGTTLPENRLGPAGDAPKAYCTTCHNGVNKPLNGTKMVEDFPSLRPAN
ncbi:MAG: photosynthetic reaction center cytochrome PufC [Limibacillus sp.]|jgi:photosynthetic reaction center cytochrome c subunit